MQHSVLQICHRIFNHFSFDGGFPFFAMTDKAQHNDGQEIHNRRGMLEDDNITRVFSPKVMESWPETSTGLGREIHTEDKAKYLLFLMSELLMYFPNPNITSC